MANKGTQFYAITSLRGGMDNSNPPNAIAEDCVVLAKNVEFLSSTLGERRLGCSRVAISTSNFTSENRICFITSHLPELAEIQDTRVFAVGVTPGASIACSIRNGAIWTGITPNDPINKDSPNIYRMRAISTHGKLFVCYKSAFDRMHVIDSDNSFRRTGLAAPSAAPTAVDTGSGSYAGTRYFRVRFIAQSGSNILRRSEPSSTLTFSPSGTGSGAIITRPAVVGEGETHWELEASNDNGNFFRIATTAIATTTVTDTAQPSSGYEDFTTSEAIGRYELMESARFVIADQDRVILVGSYEDPTHGSRVSWTPVSSATGVGNDERIPTNTTNFLDLDWQEGGEASDVSKPIQGSFYVFKSSRIYKLQRSGDIATGYESYLLTTSRGAITGSVIDGIDEGGRPCVYFLDPAVGPCRVGSFGLQQMMGLRGTWETVNTSAADLVCHGVYYPDKYQTHWWVTTNSAASPNYKIVSQVNEIQSLSTGAQTTAADGTQRGWSVADGEIANAFCSAIIPEQSTDAETGVTSLVHRPYIGKLTPSMVVRCDTGNDDDGTAYTATIRTRPYILNTIMNRYGIMAAALLAKLLDDSNVLMTVSVIRDFGAENDSVETDFIPVGTETVVIKRFDNLSLSSGFAFQFEFSDAQVV